MNICNFQKESKLVSGASPDCGHEPFKIIQCLKPGGLLPSNCFELEIGDGFSANMRTLPHMERFCREGEGTKICTGNPSI